MVRSLIYFVASLIAMFLTGLYYLYADTDVSILLMGGTTFLSLATFFYFIYRTEVEPDDNYKYA